MNSKMSLDMKISSMVLILALIIICAEVVPMLIDIYSKNRNYSLAEYITFNDLRALKNQKSKEEEHISKQENFHGGNLPLLVEFHSTYAPKSESSKIILEEVKRECKDKIDIKFIDVGLRANSQLFLKNEIGTLPTQIIYDSRGREIYRNAGIILSTGKIVKVLELLGIL